MKSPRDFIVRPVDGKRYDNTRRIGGIEMVVSTSEEDHLFSNRYGEVVEVPIGYSGPISVGDLLLVHHNTFKFYTDMKGNQRSGKSFLFDDLFLVDMDQFFMFHDGVKWTTHDRYCFVKPIPPLESKIFKPMSEEPLTGTMMYPNKYLSSKNVQKGDVVIFKPDSEYEFQVEGVKMYRMYDHQITMVL